MKYLSFSSKARRRLFYGSLIVFLSVFCGVSCSSNKSSHNNAPSGQQAYKTKSQQQPNTLTPKQKKQGWKLLFNGKTMDKWRAAYGKKLPSAWVVENSIINVQASNGKQGGGGGKFGSIVTKKEYSNFIFELDFKLTKGANTGIKYFVVENPDFFKGNPRGRGIGLEFQLIDDALPVVHPTNSTGALYAMIPPDSTKKHLNPPGEWNHARIVSKGCHVEHWLNGQKLLQYQRGSKIFRSLVAESKYNIYEGFGLAPKGHILLQDHGDQASFRNIKIKVLQANKCKKL